MKTNPFKKLTFTVLIILLFWVVGFAQNYETTKTLNKTLLVDKNVNIQMNNYDADLKILTSSENSVRISSFVEISGKSKEDVDQIISAIEGFKFKQTGNILQIETRYYQSKNTSNGRSTIVLKNGDKVRVKDVKVKHELSIPKSANLKLSNKYSEIEMTSMEGKAVFDLYNSKLYAQNFKEDINLQAKYSKIFLENLETDSEFDLYDTDIEIHTCKNLNIKSKYSGFAVQQAGDMTIDSYDDKFNVSKMNALNFVSKYSDFESQADLNEIKLEIYDCNVKVNTVRNAVFNGKYSEVILGDVESFKSDDSYDNTINIGNTRQVKMGKSRYSSYDFKSLSNFKMDDSYDDDINIGKLNYDFSGLDLNGKYGKLLIDANRVPFRVEFSMKYPKFELPESLKVSKHIEKNSQLELIAGDSGGLIKIEGYDMKVTIKD